jgi:P4 family phage/plasmid primase-like protien
MNTKNVINFDNMPAELKGYKNWVLWKLIDRNDGKKPTKIPVKTWYSKELSLKNKPIGFNSSSSNPKFWDTYENVKKAYETGKYEGVGFMFGNSPFCGIDIDNCVPDGLTNKALGLMRKFNSYTELSPSGTGIHTIIKAVKKGKGSKNPQWDCVNGRQSGLEIYDDGRYFTMTGKRIEDTTTTVEDRQSELDEVCDIHFEKKPEPAKETIRTKPLLTLDEGKIIDLAMKAKNGNEFRRLYSGDISGNGNDHSSADLALCNILAFYTKDFHTVDSIFRGSGLHRKKWDDRPDYKTWTINNAIQGARGAYDPNFNKDTRKKDSVPKEAEKIGKQDSAEQKEDPIAPKVECKVECKSITNFENCDWIHKEINDKTGKEKVTILPAILAEYIRQNENYIFVRNDANSCIMRYWYKNGYYKQISDDELKGFIKIFIPLEIQKTRDIAEVFGLLTTDLHFVPMNEINNNEKIINFQNGLLYVDTMELKEHTPSEYCTIQIPCNYNPIPESPESRHFDNFIEHLTSSDKQIKSLLLQFLGVAISNIKGWRMKKSLFMVGEGDVGKSQLKQLAHKLIGESHCSGIDLNALEGRWGASSIYNKRISGCNDMSYLTVSELKTFKLATGGDTLQAEFKGDNMFNFIYNGLLWFCCNDLPKFGGDRGSHVYNRIMIVKCNNPVPKKDKYLQDKMFEEREYIVSLALKELQKVIKNEYEFIVPESMKNDVESYKTDNNSVLSFMQDCTTERQNEKIDDNCTCKRFYDVYVAWCIDNNGGYHDSKKDVKNILTKMGKADVKPKDGYDCYKKFTLTKETKREYGASYGYDKA